MPCGSSGTVLVPTHPMLMAFGMPFDSKDRILRLFAKSKSHWGFEHLSRIVLANAFVLAL